MRARYQQNVARQAQFRRRQRQKPADGRGRGLYLRQRAFGNAAEIENALIVSAAADVGELVDAHIGDVHHRAPRHAQGNVVRHRKEHRRFFEDIGPVVPDPGDLHGVETGAELPAGALIQVVLAETGGKGRALIFAALVAPYDRRLQRFALCIDGNERSALQGER